MENKINIVEILKDCPSGMELDCTMYEDVTLIHILEGNVYPIKIKTPDGQVSLNKYGQYSNNKLAKCIIFPKGKTTWEGFQRPFKDGDILISGLEDNPFIFKRINGLGNAQCYCAISCFGQLILNNDNWTCIKGCRLATEEEKQKLFDAIKDNGYKWNPETKTLEKLPKFKDGDIVVSSLGHIHILKNRSTSYIYVDFAHNTNGSLCKSLTTCVRVVRLATEEEKQKLFDAIKDNGYKWNPETKTLEKLVEPRFKVGDRIILKDNPHNIPSIRIKAVTKSQYILENEGFFYIDSADEKYVLEDKFDINTLVPFESRVLVRSLYSQVWSPAIYGFKHFSMYMVVGGLSYCQCIPYEGNEHLCGTTNDCDNFYKTWE